MLGDKEITVDKRRFFITLGTNEYEQTEYVQLNEEGYYKPTPVIFISRHVSGNDPTVSMHFEGLPLNVFSWFLNQINCLWGIDLMESTGKN